MKKYLLGSLLSVITILLSGCVTGGYVETAVVEPVPFIGATVIVEPFPYYYFHPSYGWGWYGYPHSSWHSVQPGHFRAGPGHGVGPMRGGPGRGAGPMRGGSHR